MRYIEAGALGKLQEIIIRISYILRNGMNKLELAPPCKVGIFCPVWHNIPKGSPELTHRLTTFLFLNQYKFFRNQFNYFLFSTFYHIFATLLLQINVERNIDINLKISDCTSHEDLISTLSPLFQAEKGDTVHLVLDLINTDDAHDVYPDFLLLIVSALRYLDRFEIKPSGNIIYNHLKVNYISRMDFFTNLNVKFDEEIKRKDSSGKCIEISRFDKDTIFGIYDSIIKILDSFPSIELTVLQGLGYCFYELLDNVLNHSEENNGWVVAHYYKTESTIRIMICDTGIGIHKSLTTAPKDERFRNFTEEEAISECINDKVTNGKGMGFGLYSTANLIKDCESELIIYSGNKKLYYNQEGKKVEDIPYWQGTIIFLKLRSDICIDPDRIVDYKTDCADQYNEMFGQDHSLDDLW